MRLEREKQRTGVLLAQLERLSHEDPLTGLANRRRWDAELVSACTEARQGNSGVGVVLLDIDHFKKINDSYGHAGGDEALRAVAELLVSRVGREISWRAWAATSSPSCCRAPISTGPSSSPSGSGRRRPSCCPPASSRVS